MKEWRLGIPASFHRTCTDVARKVSYHCGASCVQHISIQRQCQPHATSRQFSPPSPHRQCQPHATSRQPPAHRPECRNPAATGTYPFNGTCPSAHHRCFAKRPGPPHHFDGRPCRLSVHPERVWSPVAYVNFYSPAGGVAGDGAGVAGVLAGGACCGAACPPAGGAAGVIGARGAAPP